MIDHLIKALYEAIDVDYNVPVGATGYVEMDETTDGIYPAWTTCPAPARGQDEHGRRWVITSPQSFVRSVSEHTVEVGRAPLVFWERYTDNDKTMLWLPGQTHDWQMSETELKEAAKCVRHDYPFRVTDRMREGYGIPAYRMREGYGIPAYINRDIEKDLVGRGLARIKRDGVQIRSKWFSEEKFTESVSQKMDNLLDRSNFDLWAPSKPEMA